jgi:hypothetical protein
MERYDSEEQLLEKELELILDNADDDSSEDDDDDVISYDDNDDDDDDENNCIMNKLTEKIALDEDSIKNSDNSINNLVEKQYIDNFNLSKNQFDLIKSYFDDNQMDKNIKIAVLLDDILEHAKHHEAFKATRSDLYNCLKLIDTDNDGFIDFNDIIEFLTLTFISKHNFKKKILSILNSRKFSHQRIGYLNQNEAYDFLQFLKKYFPSKDRNLKKNFTKKLNSTNTNDKYDGNEDDDHIYFYKDISYKNFVSRIAFYFNDKLFIEW